MNTIKEVVAGLPIIISFERVKDPRVEYDEKHYFVIPFHLSDTGFSLHTMRSLPEHIPEINDLPKRRVFHLPNEHYEATLREHMVASAIELSYANNGEQLSPLESLANGIDALDNKLTYGMLVVGGLAALVNPLIGAGIAVKAVMPSVTGLITKYGLRPVGEKLTLRQLEKQSKEAQALVLKQFSQSDTLKVVNPILQELEFALRTNESQHDPLTDPNLATGSIPQLENEQANKYWRSLTEKAVFNTYKDVVKDVKQHKAARLGPEDLRWLSILFIGHDG